MPVSLVGEPPRRPASRPARALSSVRSLTGHTSTDAFGEPGGEATGGEDGAAAADPVGDGATTGTGAWPGAGAPSPDREAPQADSARAAPMTNPNLIMSVPFDKRFSTREAGH